MGWFSRRKAKKLDYDQLAELAAAKAATLTADPSTAEADDGLTGERNRWALSFLAQSLERYYRSPAPTGDTPLEELPAVAVDVETDGLDSQQNRMLSIGWVQLDGPCIMCGTADYSVLRPDTDYDTVGQSATIHGLTDTHVRSGANAALVLGNFLHAARGRAIMAHLAKIEVDFISAMCEELIAVPWKPAAVIDTMDLQRRSATSFGRRPARGEVRLDTARKLRGLPEYYAHNALTDALACGELYLAQTAGEHFGTTLDSVRRRHGSARM